MSNAEVTRRRIQLGLDLCASPIQTCVEIELKRIRLGGVGLGLERVLFRLTEKPNRLGCWLLASPLPKTNGTVQLSG